MSDDEHSRGPLVLVAVADTWRRIPLARVKHGVRRVCDDETRKDKRDRRMTFKILQVGRWRLPVGVHLK
jgi:hypothetical protein